MLPALATVEIYACFLYRAIFGENDYIFKGNYCIKLCHLNVYCCCLRIKPLKVYVDRLIINRLATATLSHVIELDPCLSEGIFHIQCVTCIMHYCCLSTPTQ